MKWGWVLFWAQGFGMVRAYNPCTHARLPVLGQLEGTGKVWGRLWRTARLAPLNSAGAEEKDGSSDECARSLAQVLTDNFNLQKIFLENSPKPNKQLLQRIYLISINGQLISEANIFECCLHFPLIEQLLYCCHCLLRIIHFDLKSWFNLLMDFDMRLKLKDGIQNDIHPSIHPRHYQARWDMECL